MASPAMDKLVFITGASSGIGQALAWRYHQAGWRLALAARRTGEIENWARAQGLGRDRYTVYAADVADTQSIVVAGQACLAGQGVPDAVIANAGISLGVDTAVREDLEVIARTFATNNVGLAATFHPFIEPMVSRGSGALVGIGSVAGIRGLPGHGAYCASKAAVISYTQSAALAMAPHGIRVNAISPGVIDTPMWGQVDALFARYEGLQVGEKKVAVGKAVPLGRMGDPADIASAAVFLASPAASYITAQTLNVDGGNVMS